MNECRRKLIRVAVGLLNRETVVFCPDHLECSIGTMVVLNRSYGLDWGKVVGVVESDDAEITESAFRIATFEDLDVIDNSGASQDDVDDFNLYAAECGLFMRLVGVDHSLDRNKVTFYYIAEGRVDFRELVKKLNKKYQRRVELYQLNLEDQFMKYPTCGVCGIEVCCRKMNGVFGMKVSSRICKDQKLVYNPLKMSGCCGKARCCYVFEHPNYVEYADSLPKVGGRLMFRGHEWKLADWDIFRQAVLLYHPEYGRDIAVPWSEFKRYYGKPYGVPIDLQSVFGAMPSTRDRFGVPISNGNRKTSEHSHGVSERYETALHNDNGEPSTSMSDSRNIGKDRQSQPNSTFRINDTERAEASQKDFKTDSLEEASNNNNSRLTTRDNDKTTSIRTGQAIRNVPRNKARPAGKPVRSPLDDSKSTIEPQSHHQTSHPPEAKDHLGSHPTKVTLKRSVRRNITPFRPPRRPGR